MSKQVDNRKIRVNISDGLDTPQHGSYKYGTAFEFTRDCALVKALNEEKKC